MELFGKILSRQDELFVKALCFDLEIEYSISYDKEKIKWFSLKELSENQYYFLLRSAQDYFLEFQRELPSQNNPLQISA